MFKNGRKINLKFMAIEITKEQAQKLGFKSSIETSQDLGFTDFAKSSAYTLKDAYLDLENLGRLNKTNPRTVIRKPINNTITPSSENQIWQSWRQTIEEEHYYSRYNISTPLVGQLAEIHFPIDYYSYKDNNFFKPYRETKIVKRIKDNNDFNYARFRFPKDSSNTIDINIQSSSGLQFLRPKFAGIISLEENRKTYYRWHPQATRFASGQQKSNYDNLNLSGFNIPYPNTVSVYDSPVFNIPVKIAPKFNNGIFEKQKLNGIILISTGDAEQKTICYVSPHSLETGFLNTVEDIYIQQRERSLSIAPGSNLLASVYNSSWYGSGAQGYLGCFESGYIDNLNGTYKEAGIPSFISQYKRFYKVGEPAKQIYFDHTLPTPYGSGRWCMALSGNSNISINTGHRAIVYMHQPNSSSDAKKKDPRGLSGPWIVASGHPNAANAIFLNRASAKKPVISKWKTCRKKSSVITKRLQVPSLIIDSKYQNSGDVLPEGIKTQTYPYVDSMYPKWKAASIITGTLPNTGLLLNPTGNNYSGYIINNLPVSMSQILASGISIPQMVYSGIKNTLSSSGYFQQNTPLKDTYFYKFYNQLYQDNNKTIATGTWNGIIPSGVRFSVEILSTTLNSEIGIINNRNISVFYSGYGSGDRIDTALQTGISRNGAHILYSNPSEKYMISGEIPWHQKRSPYRHTFNKYNELSYSAYKSGPTLTDAKNISKITAINMINSKILQLVNKILPTATYKNKKWKSLQKFKAKLSWLKNNKFSHISIPETAEPGSEIKKRISPYKQ
jgi:hypothetical protein